MKNYFVWRRFGFRTNKYYIYQDDERFYRYFKKQLYPPYKLMPMIMAGAGAAYIALFGYAGFGTLEKAFDRPVAQIFRSLADVAIYLFILLMPLAFLPVWKETRRRYKLVDRMDHRFRRYFDFRGRTWLK